MSTAVTGADLAERIDSLDDEERRALRAYWEQVIREEWVPSTRSVPSSAALAELDERRERRSARRAMSRIAEAGRVAQMRRRPAAPGGASGGFGPGEAA